MKQLNIIILGGHWELWFLDDKRVFCDHEMDWMTLLDYQRDWGTFAWSYVYMESILNHDRRNLFSLTSSKMPMTFQELQDMLLVNERILMMDRLDENRTTP